MCVSVYTRTRSIANHVIVNTVELLYNEIVFAAKKKFTIGGFSL